MAEVKYTATKAKLAGAGSVVGLLTAFGLGEPLAAPIADMINAALELLPALGLVEPSMVETGLTLVLTVGAAVAATFFGPANKRKVPY